MIAGMDGCVLFEWGDHDFDPWPRTIEQQPRAVPGLDQPVVREDLPLLEEIREPLHEADEIAAAGVPIEPRAAGDRAEDRSVRIPSGEDLRITEGDGGA